MSKIWLLTLTWNGCDKLTKLHDSIMPALSDLNWNWLIKDNASKDNTIETVKTWEDRIKVIPYKDNRQNFSAGMNYLFAEASPADDDLVLLLNNDVTFGDASSLKKMISIIQKDSNVGVVGARLLYTNTDQLQHAGVVFDEKHAAPTHFRLKEKTDEHALKNRLFQVVTGAVLLTKAEYFKKACLSNKSGINGMDENYHWAFDDVDLCLSIKNNMEKKIVYCGGTNIFHEESASLVKNPANKLFMSHNLNLLRSKWKDKFQLDKEIYTKDRNYNLYTG